MIDNIKTWCNQWLGLSVVLVILAIGVCQIVISDSTTTILAPKSGAVKKAHVNQYIDILSGDLVPRSNAGVPTDLAGTLGSDAYKWLKLRVAKGAWKAGDIKAHHTYNGLLSCGHGWMICDGDVVSEANYNTEHGAGSWDVYVITSPLEGKYLPNLSSKYLIGADSTVQDGSTAITSVGISANTIAAHDHTVADHTHQWHSGVTGSDDFWFDSSGSAVTVSGGDGDAGTSSFGSDGLLLSFKDTADWYTTMTSYGMNNSSSFNIRPESIEVQFCMRVVE